MEFVLLQKLIKLFHTVKYLKYNQIYYRILYRLKKPSVHDNFTGLTSHKLMWKGPCLAKQSIFDNNKFCFLNEAGVVKNKADWNSQLYSKLWLYNLHYFDDLNSDSSESREKRHFNLIQQWINENPPCIGNGWEPYPISLRLVNWVKWFSKKHKVDTLYLSSIAVQAKALLQQLEYHILGNHLFANGKALAFVGSFLKGDFAESCLKKGLEILDSEIEEQFLSDGGHFELSPMYHCILLWDLLELIHLAEISKNTQLTNRLAHWKHVAQKALLWLESMLHTDGEISFFNDAAIGIAHSPEEIFKFANSLNIKWGTPLSPLHTNSDTGYSRVMLGNYCLFVDHAQVGPDYLPGHAHADTLSFELSLGSDRVFVNSGTSLYGVSEERLRQRQTAAHNTIEVAGESSSEVWSGFRVARRAKALLTRSNVDGYKVNLVASHDGYKRLRPKVIHQRAIEATAGFCQIEDTLSEQVEAVFHLHIHPSVKANKVNATTVELITPSKRAITFTSELDIKLIPTTYHPNFGVTIPSTKIVIPFSNGQLVTRMDF